MNYHVHYDRLISRAIGRVLSGYAERHHITPKCVGGDNSPENLVWLTPEEHYLAHMFLVKMHPGDHRLLWAAVCMTGGNGKQSRRGNKLYGWLRRQFAEALRKRAIGRKHTPETIAKLSAIRCGKKRKPHSEETKAKMSAASKGKTKSPEHRAKLAEAKRGKKRSPHSEETRRKISEANRLAAARRDFSFMQDAAYRASQAEKTRAVWQRRHSKFGQQPPQEGGDCPEEV